MPFTPEQVMLKDLLVEKITAKLHSDGGFLEADLIEKIASEFILVYQDFKDEIASHTSAHVRRHGEIIWSLKSQELIQQFAEKLDLIFAPLGGLNPADRSVCWSGLGLKRAEDSGLDFAKTIPGFVINQIHSNLKSVLTISAYLPDMGLWEAMSLLYAKGSVKDANIFLVDGVVNNYSILWNTELQTLRPLQFRGIIERIWVNTLNPIALIHYRALLEERKLSFDPRRQVEVDEKILTTG